MVLLYGLIRIFMCYCEYAALATSCTCVEIFHCWRYHVALEAEEQGVADVGDDRH